jgi:hypothetical protein
VANHKFSDKFGMSGTSGHLHRGEYKTWTNLMGGYPNRCSWLQTPGLHRTDASYVEDLSQSNMGFSIVYISQSTKEVIQQLHQVHHDWAIINGKIYRRK